MKIFRYPSAAATKRLDRIVHRRIDFRKKDQRLVEQILSNVRRQKDAALIEYGRQFDCPTQTVADLRVTDAEMAQASKSVSRKFRQALNMAARQIEKFHRHQKRKSWMDLEREGTFLGQMIVPVENAGVYVPGGQEGKTPLVSSVLMGAIPAQIAGVPRIVMVSPPGKDGRLDPHLLVAARKAGVNEIYKVGSAWAIAALAYGTESIAPVDVIVGPGNIYVTLAKKMVSGTVGIDMIAGPSEVLVVADQWATPEYLAADLLAQAEHDALASSVLVTDDEALAKETLAAMDRQLAQLPRKAIAKESLDQYGAAIIVPDLELALEVANRVAPEHLELQVADPYRFLGRIRNAGAVFLGTHTPEPIGDYVAGPNHVLPTAGTARFSSALSVDHFIKKISVLHYTEKAFRREARHVLELARIEGLEAHARSIAVRMQK